MKTFLQSYLKRKWQWVDNNPRKAAWIGWAKGLLTGLLICLLTSFTYAQDSHLNVGIMSGMNLKNEMGMIGLSVVESHDESRIVYGINVMSKPEKFKPMGMVFMGYKLKKYITTSVGISLQDFRAFKKSRTKPLVKVMIKPTSYPLNFFISQSLFNKEMPFTKIGVRYTLFNKTIKENNI